MNDILPSTAIHTAKLFMQKKIERNVIIDPFSCLMKLSLLRFLDSGTKISIYQNRIYFNSPSYFQGVVRFLYGDNREHLHNLYLPIQKCVEWFWDDNDSDMKYMFNNAIIGLKMLKISYNEYATIQHTIDYYIIIMMQKHSYLISKFGINTLDIEKITSGLMEYEDKPIENKTNDKPMENNKTIENKPNDNQQNNDKNKSGKNKSGNTSGNTNKNSDDKDKESSLDATIINAKDIRDSIVLKKMQEETKKTIVDSKQNDIQLNDMNKFLFELWSKREINIVINLYKEMEVKSKGIERENIYANIMSYCSMKENNLFEYIEKNSSILQK